MQWLIRITCCGEPTGPEIPALGWNVWSRVAAVGLYIPDGWTVDAYPVLEV
jgi:hypothetical protein